MLPPLEEHGVANELEPRSEDQLCIQKHGLELVGGDVAGIADLVEVWLKINIGLDKEDIVD